MRTVRKRNGGNSQPIDRVCCPPSIPVSKIAFSSRVIRETNSLARGEKSLFMVKETLSQRSPLLFNLKKRALQSQPCFLEQCTTASSLLSTRAKASESINLLARAASLHPFGHKLAAWRIPSSADTLNWLLLTVRGCRYPRANLHLQPKLFMPKMRAAQVARPGEPFEIVEREIPEPGAGWVRIRVQACGICHSDVMVKDGHVSGLQYPRVPGSTRWSV